VNDVICTHPHSEGSERCRLCNGLYIRRQHALDRAEDDLELLRLRDVEHLSAARIAVRLNISRNRVYPKIEAARRRQRVLQKAS